MARYAPKKTHDLHAGLTVSMIATKRCDFVTCQKKSSLPDLVAGNSDKFSYMPVIEKGSDYEHVVGVVHLEPYFETAPPKYPLARPLNN